MVQEKQYFILSDLACNEENDNKPNLTFIQSGPMTAVSAALSVGFQVSVQSLCFNISPKRANMSLLRQKRRCFIFVSDDCWVQMEAAERSQHSSSDPLKEYSRYNTI